MKGFLVSIVPSVGALFILWITLRAIFQADRRERAALARFEAESDRSSHVDRVDRADHAGEASAGDSGDGDAAS